MHKAKHDSMKLPFLLGNYLEIADFCSEKKVSHLFVSPDELSDLATYFRVTTPLAKHIFLKSIKRITCSGDTLPLRSTYQDVMSSFSGVDTEVRFSRLEYNNCILIFLLFQSSQTYAISRSTSTHVILSCLCVCNVPSALSPIVQNITDVLVVSRLVILYEIFFIF